MPGSAHNELWPELPYEAWKDTRETLHLWTQIAGKIRLALTPWLTPGEIVLFDRSWYNRAGVEHVMGFCTLEEYHEFLRSCPLFEEMLVRSGIYLIKYWFSVNDEEQERRFQERINNPVKRWKLSPMDLESRRHWVEYSKAKDVMLAHTDRENTPWWVVNAMQLSLALFLSSAPIC